MTSAKPKILDVPNTWSVRVSVVEDDALVREQLVHQLNRVPGFNIISSHNSAEKALEEIRG